MTYQWAVRADSLFTDGEYALAAVIGEIDDALIEHVNDAEGLEIASALDREDYDAVGMLIIAALRRLNAERTTVQAWQDQDKVTD